MKNAAPETEKAISGAIKIDEKEIRTHLDGLVRQSVEDTLNAEADAICQASRYQSSPDRQDTRAGSYKRKLLTKAGEVELHVPRLRTLLYGSVALCTGIEMLSTLCPWKHLREVVVMLKAIHAQEDKAAARQKAALVAEN